MTDRAERRRFPRLDIPEEARVYDENGRELGKVSQVSGGGMNLQAVSNSVAQAMEPGRKLRISVIEPGSRATNVVDVIVRQQINGNVGLEFAD